MLQPIIRDDDTFLSYLPLAHVLAFTVEHVCLFWGVSMGYGSPRTLTDASVRNCLGDIRELKPSLMIGVPAVWESIRKGVLAKVHAGSPTVQRVFNAAFKAKGWLMNKGLPTRVLDAAVFNKIKQQTYFSQFSTNCTSFLWSNIKRFIFFTFIKSSNMCTLTL